MSTAHEEQRGPSLARRARLAWSPHRDTYVVLWPESVVTVSRSAAEVLARCDGTRTERSVIDELRVRFPGAPVERDATELLARLRARGLVRDLSLVPASSHASAPPVRTPPVATPLPPPDALLAELTYRCPLRCGYCSNPTELAAYDGSLDTDAWRAVLTDAARAGALHVHFSGGEPLLRADLEALVAHARSVGLYTNLITSAHGLTLERLDALAEAGLEHVQVSVQHVDAAVADRIAGTRAHEHKLAMARAVVARGLALSVNVVLHRDNVGEVGSLISLAESLGATRVELANAQYHGWALRNRDALLPSLEDLARAGSVAARERDRLRGTLDVLFVLPDYYTDAPRPCMDGWARRFVTVTPEGLALPCPGAHALPLPFERVTAVPLSVQWREGAAFRAFRGTDWMPEPCASCDRRSVDHGGCRCQSFALTGDASRTDPACAKSPDHPLVLAARENSTKPAPEVLYRVRTKRAL